MTKNYQTTAPTQDSSRAPHHRTPVEMTELWAKAIGLLTFAALSMIAGVVTAAIMQSWAFLVFGLFLAVVSGVPGVTLAIYTKLEHVAAYGAGQPKAKRTGDVWRIHLKREIPVADRGTVDMGADVIDLPVAPKEFTRIVRDMKRNGTSIDKRPPGVSQPLRTKILRALEDMEGATNGGSGVGWKLSDDIDALLRDIDQW